MTDCPHYHCLYRTLTPAAWIRGLNSTTLHSNQLLMSPCHLCVSSMMSVTCLFYLLSFYELVSFSVPLAPRTARIVRVGVVFWSPRGSGGPGDAASRSPRVKGEKAENRAFWSAGEDLPALFCMLEFGQGVTSGWGGDENRWEGERNERKRLVQLRTNDRHSAL